LRQGRKESGSGKGGDEGREKERREGKGVSGETCFIASRGIDAPADGTTFMLKSRIYLVVVYILSTH